MTALAIPTPLFFVAPSPLIGSQLTLILGISAVLIARRARITTMLVTSHERRKQQCG